ncbi:cytochrome d ubiquinol oxidase subunit II [Dermabacteraceae bacterium P13103]
MDMTFLQILWFTLIAVLFTGYFVLEGFDFGVGMNVLFLGKGDEERRSVMLRTIGPVWDGNQVWLLVGGGAMFAAFPAWYATLFSGFYLALLAILVALIVRVCAFKYREKSDSARWRKNWDLMHFIGGFFPSLLWGVAFANIVQGVAINKQGEVTTSLLGLLNPFGLLGGVVFVLLFWMHGTLYLAIKTDGEVRADANKLAGKLFIPVILGGAVFLVWAQLMFNGKALTWIPLVLAALSLIALIPLHAKKLEKATFWTSCFAIAMASAFLFGCLFPNVLPSNPAPANSLTIPAAASTEYTLLVMTVATVLILPFVLAYQIWAYWVFRDRISDSSAPAENGLLLKAKEKIAQNFSV